MENQIKLKATEQIDSIISDVTNLIDKDFDFQAFIVLVLGIEFLGNFNDEKPFDEFNQSKIRFCNRLDNFRNVWYKNNKEWLFKNLRGTLIHQYRPGENILLTSNHKNGAQLGDHLKLSGNKRIFVIEAFLEDYKKAASYFKNLIQRNHNLNKEKLESDHSEIVNIDSPTSETSYPATGATMTQTILPEEGVKKGRKERRQLQKKEKKK